MTTSVKMGERAKRELDRLRDDLSKAAGRRLTTKEVLEAFVRSAPRTRDIVLSEITAIRYPVSPETVRATHAIAEDWGGRTSEEDIDRVLYGGRRRRQS